MSTTTIPVHSWILIEPPGQGKVLAFTYIDPSEGLSARGGNISDPPTKEELGRAAHSPDTILRLPGFATKTLTPDEVKQHSLPEQPEWLRPFFEESAVDPVWREHPKIKDKFHPRHPDDLKAIFFFPEIRRAEAMWVRLINTDDEIGGYRGLLLNQPQSAKEPKVQSLVTIRSVMGVQEPVYISPIMRQNWREWRSRCRGCGFDLIFEPIEEMTKRAFPPLPPGTQLQTFTARCLLCAETIVVEHKDLES